MDLALGFVAILLFAGLVIWNIVLTKQLRERTYERDQHCGVAQSLEGQLIKADARICELDKDLETLKKAPKPTLTVEAQQILHDMTAHGHSVVRITPLNPSDIFWRAPH